jgi:hypothetical protein
MFLRFEENPNFGFVDDRVFMERTEARAVSEVLRQRQGKEVWCPVTAMESAHGFGTAMARKVEDSGEGMCWLVYGGLWGLRLKDPSCPDAWSLEDPHQWGEGFLLLPADGADLHWAEAKGEST